MLSVEEATEAEEVLELMHSKLIMNFVLLLFPFVVVAYLVALLAAVQREKMWPPHDYAFLKPLFIFSFKRARLTILALLFLLILFISVHLIQIQHQVVLIEIIGDSFSKV